MQEGPLFSSCESVEESVSLFVLVEKLCEFFGDRETIVTLVFLQADLDLRVESNTKSVAQFLVHGDDIGTIAVMKDRALMLRSSVQGAQDAPGFTVDKAVCDASRHPKVTTPKSIIRTLQRRGEPVRSA